MWLVYRAWCRAHGHTTSNFTSPKVTAFLLYLRDVRKVSVSCVRGYLAMLNSLAKYKGVDLAQDVVVKNLIKSFQREVLRRPPAVPSWNLDVVLKALTLPPFEPLGQASRKDLTSKCLFLLALATAHRVSELQAVSYVISFQQGDMILEYLPEFIAKTESSTNVLPREVRVKSLSEVVGRHDEERLICPVRAIKFS